MTFLEIFLLIVLLLIFAMYVVLLIMHGRQKKNIIELKNNIDEFIKRGTLTDFSVSDNDFAMLQNSVADLENMVRIEKSNMVSETKKNTEFISDISHQLKTPLAGLRLYCEMTNSVSPSEYTEKEILLIERMENLIQKLIRLEKIKSDSYSMDFQFYSVNDIVGDLLSEFHHLFPKKNYTVSGRGQLRCDRAWISEALGNIIKNASEHTAESGNVDIIIDESNHSTNIEIIDNGGGIKDADINNLFERFYRADNLNPNSAGIGLAITKAIVEKHHGIINAENKNGGLSVNMCFPHIDGYVKI